MSTASGLSWGAAWKIARRDLNARFKGLRLLLVCIFLGTAALAAIGTLTAAMRSLTSDLYRKAIGVRTEGSICHPDTPPLPGRIAVQTDHHIHPFKDAGIDHRLGSGSKLLGRLKDEPQVCGGFENAIGESLRDSKNDGGVRIVATGVTLAFDFGSVFAPVVSLGDG